MCMQTSNCVFFYVLVPYFVALDIRHLLLLKQIIRLRLREH